MYLTQLIKLANKMYEQADDESVELIHHLIEPHVSIKMPETYKKADKLLPTLILIRHGETSMNSSDDKSKEVLRGWADVPLKDDIGFLQAERLASFFRHFPIAHIYSSDLQRAHFTAKSIQRTTNAKLTLSPSLRPWHMGVELQGKPVGMYVPIMIEYINKENEIIPGSSESFKTFQKRCLSKLKELMDKTITEPEKGLVICVAHSRNTRLLHSWILAECKDVDVIDKTPLLQKDDTTRTGHFMAIQYSDNKWNLIELPGQELLDKP